MHSSSDEITMEYGVERWYSDPYTFGNCTDVEIFTESTNVVDELVKQAKDALEKNSKKDKDGNVTEVNDEKASSQLGFKVETLKDEEGRRRRRN